MELWFCHPCTIAAVNDDTSGMSDEQALLTSKGLERLGFISADFTQFDRGKSVGIHEDTVDKCDCCGTRSYGDRYRFWDGND